MSPLLKKTLMILGGWCYIIAVGVRAYYVGYYNWPFTAALFIMGLLITAVVIKTSFGPKN